MKKPYKPDYVISPGAILLEIMEARDITEDYLADRCLVTKNVIEGIISGDTVITSEMAKKLESALEIDARIWCNLDNSYRIIIPG